MVSEADSRPDGGRQGRSEERTSSQTGTTRREPARTITIDSEHAGRRLDKFLRSRLKGVPAGLIFRLLRQGRLRVNGRKAPQDHRLRAGDVIDIPELRIDSTAAPQCRVPPTLLEQMRNAVLHEDQDLLIVDQPAGVAVHQHADVPARVIEALRDVGPELSALGLCHRLGRDAPGGLAVATWPSMRRYLPGVLRDGEEEIERHYVALVAGSGPWEREALDATLRRDAA